MKMKISDLHPNPFKKNLAGGKLNPEQVKKIRANIKELGLMGSLPIVKIDGKYCLVSGHHRIEALRQEFGKTYEVECTLHNYSEENMLRGMIVENLTQRAGEFREETDNLVIIRKMLKEHPKWLHSLNIFKECKTEADRKRQERDGTGVNVFTPKKCGVGKSIL